MNRYKKLIKNTALITVGNFASKLLTFFLLPLYTAILTTAEYGVADLDDYDSQSDHTFFYIDYLGSRNEVCAR